MSRIIKAIIKDSGDQVGKEVHINNALWNLETLVEGFIEIAEITNGSNRIAIIYDGDGKLKNKPVNIRIETMERIELICGTAIICGENDRGDLVSLPFDLATWERNAAEVGK